MMSKNELFDRFTAHGTTTAEVAAMGLETVTRQIGEMRRDEPDDLPLTDAEIARAVLDYAQEDVEARWLTPAEIDAFPGESSVDVAILSGGVWYYGDSGPGEEDPTGLTTAQFCPDEDGYYIPVAT